MSQHPDQGPLKASPSSVKRVTTLGTLALILTVKKLFLASVSRKTKKLKVTKRVLGYKHLKTFRSYKIAAWQGCLPFYNSGRHSVGCQVGSETMYSYY